MASDADLESIFGQLATAGTNAAAADLSGTNLPDIRNIQSTPGGVVVGEAEAALSADLASVRRPGVPLDTTTGAPAGTRFRLAFTSDVPDEVKLLQSKYGVENIAISPQGKLVIRNLLDESTGQVRDVLVDETQMSAKDLLDISGAIPEVIGAIAAMRGGKALPGVGKLAGKTGFVRDVLAGSVGGQAAGELAQRALGDTAATLGETVEKRARGAAADVGFNLLTAGAGAVVPRVLARIRGPLAGSQTLVQTEAVEAIDRLAQKTGIKIPLSIGEETGSPLIMRAEALAEKIPGSSGTIRQAKAEQEDSMRQIQQFMLGQSPMPTESSVGLEAIDRLKQLTGATEEVAADAKRQIADVASAEILTAFDTLSLPSRQMFKRPVGQAIRAKASAELDAFKTRSRQLYNEVYSTPGANDPIIPTKGLKAIAAEIKADLPKQKKIIETLDFDTYGSPVVRTTEGKEILTPFVPPNLKQFIDKLATGLDPKMPLNEVVQMRQIINDAIGQADVLPGIGTRYLKQVSHALTEALEQGVKDAPDATLATKLKAANEYYKTERPRFEKRGIVEMFRESTNPGYVGDAEIVKRVAGGEVSADRYFDFKEFLGPASSEFRMMKRAVLDDLYETSRITGQGTTIDAATFIEKVRGLDREVAADLLGDKADSVINAARMLGQVQGKIDSRDLDRLISSGTATSESFQKLIAAQQKLDSAYANTVIKKFVKGEAGTESIVPEEFVGRYLDVAKSSGEIQEVMSLLQDRPDLTESIRRKTLERFFAKAARNPDPIDITKNITGDPTRTVSGKTMLKALGDEQDQAKLRAVLGDETMAMLKDLVRVESALEAKEGVAKTVGGLVGGGILSRLMQLDFKDAASIAKYKIVAHSLANPAVRRWMTVQVAPPDTADLARSIIASGPFIQAMTEELGDVTGATALLNNLNDALESAAGAGPANAPATQGQKVSDQQLEQLLGP